MGVSPQPDGSGAGANDPIPVPDRPGFLTTEFWVTVLTLFLPAVTFVFHQDFSGEVQAIAAAAAGIATAVYTISRALTKSSQMKSTAIAVAARATTARVSDSVAGDEVRGVQDKSISPAAKAAAITLTNLLHSANGSQDHNQQPNVTVFTVDAGS